MRLGEGDTGGTFFLRHIGKEVAFPCSIGILFEPCDAEAVCIEGSDHIGATVAVHIRSEHLRATFFGERSGVECPWSRAVPISGMLPPAASFEDVGTAIGIDVAMTDAVGVALESSMILGGDGIPFPCSRGMGGIEACEADFSAGHAEEIGSLVTVDIDKHGRFVVGGD